MRADAAPVKIYDAVKKEYYAHGRGFTAEEVSFFIWEAGMGTTAFHMSFPDTHKLHYCLWGKKGMVARGFLLYDKQSRTFTPGKDPRQEPVNKPSSSAEYRYSRMMKSAAFRLFSEGVKDIITYEDALEFWGNWYSAPKALENATSILQDTDREEVRILRPTHEYLVAKYGKRASQEHWRNGHASSRR